MANVYRLEANVQWKVTRDQKTGDWIGVCEPLQITSLGETQEDLHISIFETMDTLFRDLLVDGELGEFLLRRGWAFQGNRTPERKLPDEEFQFEIPIEVMMANHVNAGA